MNDFQTWIDQRNKQWSNPTGFLSISSINWLEETPQSFSDVSGSWWAIDHEVHASGFEGAAERVWQLPFGSEISEPMSGGVLEIASRGGRVVLRPRNSSSPALERFSGVNTFDYDPDLAVEADLIEEEKTTYVVKYTEKTNENTEALLVECNLLPVSYTVKILTNVSYFIPDTCASMWFWQNG
ncbi:MAG: hypothetical protein EBY26_00830, partial [Microbacteriaceae bacterium]|nr:hypothetical protein [Microbacteriaceae bacterium]